MRLIKSYWPRRRSGGVVAEKESVGSGRPVEEELKMMVVMDNGPHRELPVDVPESFMPRNKTPPRYPPPRPRPQGSLNGCTTKPVPPPRDIQPLPPQTQQVQGVVVVPQTVINNNNTEPPTKQQLDSIRKYQEQLRKRREDEEELSSLRGSKKLAALESRPPLPPPVVGLVNQGFASDEPQQSLYSPIDLGEVVGAGQRVITAGRSVGLDCSRLELLLESAQFARALSTLELLHRYWPLLDRPSPLATNAQALARDCIESVQRSCLPEAAELIDLLTRYEFEGLLYSHDAIARELAVPPHSPPPSPTPPHEESNIKIIKIEKTNEPLGATVRNEGESVIIGRVVRGGAAEKSGLLHEGDEVLEVNGVEMRGKSVNEVCDLLSAMTGTLTFLVVPSKHHRPHRDTLMHVKANFDYDPEEDLYIPCRELGVSFQKGDILHVICQDDPNWWQAYREGEEDQTLAGLIPSKSFQHQRESMKQAITGDRLNKEKSKKAGTFLCAKKNTKKKKKKSPYGGYESGYPIYTSNTDDYEVDEILTYDEVALYYPRANHKRPIVLIGPPNIGRHELRQRLMEDSERFAAAVPHTSRARKEGEVDGTDYHFISRAQFEADILARRFVEHGEYERALYGTSVEAIRSVVAGGKICVLNLHPQSLRILRASDLKPYVVFVAPPSLEKLRQKKIRSGEAYKEEELKDIIEKAREMEDKYGHYFDMIINNNDTERAYHQLLSEINILEREPQWVPAAWLKSV